MRACVLLKDAHTVFKNNTTDCFRICFVKQGGGGCHLFYGDPKGGKSLELKGGVTFFKGIQKGGQKNRVNQNENL